MQTIAKEIIAKTQAVEDFVLGKIDLESFFEQYGNLYYELAVYELPEEEQVKFRPYASILEIHREIQENAVNDVYWEDYDIEILHRLHRITPSESAERLKGIYQKHKSEIQRILRIENTKTGEKTDFKIKDKK